VGKNSVEEQAGIRAEDILHSWSDDSGHGVFESPFDVDQIRIERAPRGTIVIQGRRGSEERTWTIRGGVWGLVTRPSLSAATMAAYRRGQEFAKTGQADSAARAWKESMSEFAGPELSLARLWLMLRVSESFAASKQWSDADAAYAEAVKLAANWPASAAAPLVLRSWASTYKKRNDWTNADKYYQQAITEARAMGLESLMVALLLNDLGSLADMRGDLAKSEGSYQQALAIRERLAPGSLDFAATLNNLGVVAWRRGDLTTAADHYQAALTIREKLAPGSLDTAGSLEDLGIVTAQRGDLAAAEDYCRRALEIRENLSPDTLDVAKSLVNLGSVLQYRGELARAEENYRQALSIEQRLAPAGLYYVPGTLTGLSLIADRRGDLARAEQYLKQALEVQQKLTPHSLAIAATLNDLGEVVQNRGNLAEAEKYLRQALELRQEFSPGSLAVAETLRFLGTAALKRQDVPKAAEYFNQALALDVKLIPNSPPTADVLSDLGEAALQSGNLDEAESYYRRALEIRQDLVPGSTDHAEALVAVARILVRRDRPESAASMFAQALDALETQTKRLGGSTASRSGFRAEYAGYYKDYIDLLMRLKQPEAAFQVLERSRARTLLETLAEARADIRKGADAALLARERRLREVLNTKSNRQIEILSDTHTEAEVKAIAQEIEGVVAQYQDLQAQLRATSPGYAALTQPQPISTKDVQEQLLDEDTVLLEYSLAEQRSYVWAVTRDSVTTYELPSRAAIEKEARRVYDLLTERNRNIKNESPARKQARLDNAARAYNSVAAALSRIILHPVAATIGPSKRLLVVSDGALQYIPFAALPEPEGMKPGERYAPPLVIRHEILNLPSASVLAALRRGVADRGIAPKTVAVLADPVFARSDARVHAKGVGQGQRRAARTADQAPPAFDEPLRRSLADVGLLRSGGLALARLPNTRLEAGTILSFTAPGEGMEALDFQASRATATSTELAQYRIIHFATHGLLDSEHPELSGLVFSLVNSRGEPENGFLGLEDIYNMTLSADLVVLSACKTGLGKDIQSEGLVGLTRGFMYAGASKVVASLWNINDAATAELMGRFYRAMLKQGLRPAAALRQAQRETAQQQRWRHPYFWSGLVIQGDWR
jgi:CHAT domain-containing protein/Tfp pilus assembly protein PilF